MGYRPGAQNGNRGVWVADDDTGARTPLEVTVVSSYGTMGGAERWLLDLLDATDRLRVDAVLLGEGALSEELRRRGVPWRLVPAGARPADLVQPVRVLTRRLRERRPEVVLANGLKAALVAGVAGRLAGSRTVWATHDHSFDGPVSSVAARLTDAAVATSPELAAASRHRWVEVVPPPRPDDPPLDRVGARRALTAHGVPADGLVLGLVGRLTPYKGCEDAVRALAEEPAVGWRVALVGPDEPGGERARLEDLARRLDVIDRVCFTGPIEDARRLMAGFDAVGVLTRAAADRGPDREGFGLTALEAMVAGVPVVTAGEGPVSTRLDGRAGLCVPPADPVAIAAALARLTEAPEREVMGAAGRRIVAAHPRRAACADALARHLAAVGRRPGAGLRGTEALSVVTTVKDEAGSVDELLAGLRSQLRVPGDEVVVVDGGSRDGTEQRLREHARDDPRVRVLHAPGAGISAGRNIGIAAAANARVACTDAGCRPAPRWLEAFRAAAAEDDPPELLTGIYRPVTRTSTQAAFAAVGYPDPEELRRPTLLARLYGRLLGRSFDPTRPTGRSLSVTAAAWRAAGGFPEHLQTGEDVLFGRAVAARGRAQLVADAEVTWEQRGTTAGTARMYYTYGRGSGRSRDPVLLGRDLLRAAVYPAGLAIATRGRAARIALACAVCAYLSLPLRRAARAPGALLTIAAVPPAAAVRDLAKAAGALTALVGGRRP